MKLASRERGFTMPELVVVCVLVFALTIAALIFAHPENYAAARRNALRWESTAAIAQALNRYVAANGQLPPGITSEPLIIGSDENMIDLCFDLVPDFLHAMPLDPQESAASSEDCSEVDAQYISGFTIQRTDTKTVLIAAPVAELGEAINIARTY